MEEIGLDHVKITPEILISSGKGDRRATPPVPKFLAQRMAENLAKTKDQRGQARL